MLKFLNDHLYSVWLKGLLLKHKAIEKMVCKMAIVVKI